MTKKEFDQFWTVNYKYLLNTTRKIFRDRELASDILHESYGRCLKNINTFSAIDNKLAWVTTVARNVFKNSLRRDKSLSRIKTQKFSDQEFSYLSMVIEQIDQKKLLKQLAGHIEKLPRKQRKAVELFLEDLQIKDIAEIMNSPYDTAKGNLRHATNRLRTLFFPEQPSQEPTFDQTLSENNSALLE